MNAFRQFHLHQIFENYDRDHLPIDLFLRNYFRSHKAVGSKDRKSLCESVYAIIRWKGLIDHFCERPITWRARIEMYQTISLAKERTNPLIPFHVRMSFPKFLYERIEEAYGQDQAEQLCLCLNEQAPVTIRINPLKTSRYDLLKRWDALYEVSPCTYSSLGITFYKKINFFALKEFKEGLFEVQDEASQLVGQLVDARPGDKVLDYCAGSGGKTLAFAPKMRQKGQVFLHDVRQKALFEAKKRLKRAGIQNAGCFVSGRLPPSLKKKMQWVLLDVPCSGSGTLRRNPDQKWKFGPEMMEELREKQRDIFRHALEYLHPKGRLIYATCSILPEENEMQLAYFEKEFGIKLLSSPFYSRPSPGGMDGFFAATLKVCEKNS